MSRLSLELSDALGQLADDLDQFTHGGIVMDGETVSGLVLRLRALRCRARALETETSRKRWNEDARRERLAETETILAAVTAPGSNVALFPVIPRPFCDGNPRGAA